MINDLMQRRAWMQTFREITEFVTQSVRKQKGEIEEEKGKDKTRKTRGKREIEEVDEKKE
jgi:hypothetical protein